MRSQVRPMQKLRPFTVGRDRESHERTSSSGQQTPRPWEGPACLTQEPHQGALQPVAPGPPVFPSAFLLIPPSWEARQEAPDRGPRWLPLPTA